MTIKWWESAQNWINDTRDFTDLTGRRFADQTDALMSRGGQYVGFTHIPTGTEIKFKAFLTQFNDSYKQNWNSTDGYGRMDPIQTYKNTRRTIQIGFTVPAASIEEAKANLQKVSTFAQMMYPVFDGESGAQTIKSAPFVKMRFMNWVQSQQDGLLGTLSGFSFGPDLKAGVFQTSANNKEKNFTIYPKAFTISTTLTVVHEDDLGWEKTEVEGGTRRNVNKGTTTRYQLKDSVFTPQTPSFPYGETTTPRTRHATSEEQIEDNNTNKEVLKANQEAITQADNMLGAASLEGSFMQTTPGAAARKRKRLGTNFTDKWKGGGL